MAKERKKNKICENLFLIAYSVQISYGSFRRVKTRWERESCTLFVNIIKFSPLYFAQLRIISPNPPLYNRFLYCGLVFSKSVHDESWVYVADGGGEGWKTERVVKVELYKSVQFHKTYSTFRLSTLLIGTISPTSSLSYLTKIFPPTLWVMYVWKRYIRAMCMKHGSHR